MVANMKAEGAARKLIARELALDIAEATYRPDVLEHIPGPANVWADCLSRLGEPGAKYSIPPELANVREEVPPYRTRSWWRSLP